ncbi:MAG TPA: hypothetical protein VLR94_00740, partial [Acidobacteriota bacterium]|nr:hypothetical protein [Acidobacteriota bacterium]
PGISTASLVSYYKDSRHFYEFALDGRTLFWSLRKVDKSGASMLAQGPVPGSPRAFFRLGLYCRDGDLRAFVDGVMVADEVDARPLQGGAFGLAAQGAEAGWDNVQVRTSNPSDFFYAIRARTSDSTGSVTYSGTHLLVTNDSGRPVSGVLVYRIRRDGLSYFICQDPAARYAPRSGFLTEFELLAEKSYRIVLHASSSGVAAPHTYLDYQVQWLQDFLRRSARLAPDRVTVQLNDVGHLHLRNGAFLDAGNEILTDAALGNPGQSAEVNQLIFGNWEKFGNYVTFPSLTGQTGSGANLVDRAAGSARVPQNSLFTLHVLHLAAGGPEVSITWFVQEDSRAFVRVDSAGLPSQLQRGKTFDVPFSILNNGENAGAFQFSVVLSRNSFPGPTDFLLGRRSYSGLTAGGSLQSDITIQVPDGVPDGRYFIATFLEPANLRDRLLRVVNGNFVQPIALGSFPANGRLTFTLTWNGSADLDLHVTDPFGETIYYFHPSSASGGSLLNDRECGDTTDQPEVISYPSGQAASGKYQVSIHYFRACGASRDASWSLMIDSDKGSQSLQGVAHPGDYVHATDYVR